MRLKSKKKLPRYRDMPRTVTGCQNRAKRLKCLGNAVVPAQARPFFEAIKVIEEVEE